MISACTPNDHEELVNVWQSSVRASHHFLDEDYLQKIKSLLPDIFPHVKIHVYKAAAHNGKPIILGFLGTDEDKIEMLFIHPDFMGQGIGKKLTEFAIKELSVKKVDVNEQNTSAHNFYVRMGFKVISRSEVDGLGKPYPLLHMQLIGSK